MLIVDSLIQFAIDKVGWDILGDSGFRDRETISQYIAYHLLHGNLQWVLDEGMQVTGILIAYECSEDEAKTKFNWKQPVGKNCIFVAQVASKDPESLKILAYGFLDRFKDKKTTFCVRRGLYTTMNAHDISERLVLTLGEKN